MCSRVGGVFTRHSLAVGAVCRPATNSDIYLLNKTGKNGNASKCPEFCAKNNVTRGFSPRRADARLGSAHAYNDRGCTSRQIDAGRIRDHSTAKGCTLKINRS